MIPIPYASHDKQVKRDTESYRQICKADMLLFRPPIFFAIDLFLPTQ